MSDLKEQWEQEKIQKNEDIVSRSIADEIILVPIHHNIGDVDCIYTLNSVGARIWELIDGENSFRSIKKILSIEYNESCENIERDLIFFVNQLEEIKAICIPQKNPQLY